MADVKVKMGGYTIPALTTQDFTFWWEGDYLPAAYFNVSIEPNAKGLDMISFDRSTEANYHHRPERTSSTYADIHNNKQQQL